MTIELFAIPVQVDAFDPVNDYIYVSDGASVNGTGRRLFSDIAAAVQTARNLIDGSGTTGLFAVWTDANTVSAFPAGGNGDVLVQTAGVPTWVDPSTLGFVNGMGGAGRLATWVDSDTLTDVAPGVDGDVLTQVAGVPQWVTPTPAVAGADTEVQFNDGGVLGAEPSFTFDKTTGALQTLGTGGITSRPAAGQDGMRIRGAASGASNYTFELYPTSLSANRGAQFPDASFTVTGCATNLVLNRIPFGSVNNLLQDSGNLTFVANVLGVNGTVQTGAGSAAAPSFSFLTDTDTGLYAAGANILGLATAGVARFTIDANSGVFQVPILATAGTALIPSVAFSGSSSGLYLAGADVIGFSAGGVARVLLSGTVLEVQASAALSAPRGYATTQTLGVGQTLGASITSSIFIGDNLSSSASVSDAVLIGVGGTVGSSGVTAIGDFVDASSATCTEAVIIGSAASVESLASVVIGAQAYGGGDGSVVIGHVAAGGSVSTTNAVIIGREATIEYADSVAIGAYSYAYDDSVSLGAYAGNADGDGFVRASDTSRVMFLGVRTGSANEFTLTDSIALGYEAMLTANQQFQVGTNLARVTYTAKAGTWTVGTTVTCGSATGILLHDDAGGSMFYIAQTSAANFPAATAMSAASGGTATSNVITSPVSTINSVRFGTGAGTVTIVNPLSLTLSTVLTADGTAAAPAHSFTSDSNTGLYSVGADQLGVSTGGTLRVTVSTTEVTSTLRFVAPLGLATSPTYGFTGDPNTGIFSSGADTLDFSTGGSSRMSLSIGSLGIIIPIFGAAGSAAAPQYTFTADPDTGFYNAAANQFNVATGGTLRMTISSSGVDSNGVPMRTSDGSAAAPGFTFTGDTNTGLYRIGADQLGISTNGTLRVTVDTSVVTTTLPFRAANGSTTTPSYSFTNGTGSGMYLNTATGFIGFCFSTTEFLRIQAPAAGQTALFVYDQDNATLERVTVGAADSGGAGFKVLRIPN